MGEISSFYNKNMNLATSNLLTWKISRIPSLENKGAKWAQYTELVIAHTAGFCK